MRKTIQYRSEYVLFLLLYTLVRALPLRMALRLGSALGTLIYFAQPQRRSKARENLRRAFPEKREEECRTLLRERSPLRPLRRKTRPGIRKAPAARIHSPS